MVRTVAQKMGVKAGMRAHLAGAPEAVLEAMALPDLELRRALDGSFDYVHLFAASQSELDEAFPRLAMHLKPTGMLWVSWQKAKQNGTDLSLPHVIRIGYSHGLVESTTLSVDATWSAMKFTHPKPGKTYKNSYGRLPDATD